MPGNIYALLVGIDQYGSDIQPLQGCKNDVELFGQFLEDRFRDRLRLESRLDGEATYSEVIDTFGSHLIKQATPADIALFVFCGYGAQSPSALAEGFDDGLVCADSRVHGTPDLARPELAALLHELHGGERGPHVAVILDCCSSGTVTQDSEGIARFTDPGEERALGDYLEGYYARSDDTGRHRSPPESKHIRLAACAPSQTARERDGRGIFSGTLLEALGGTDQELPTYADLSTRCRVSVKSASQTQDPDFRSFGRFNFYKTFLGADREADARATVYFDFSSNAWTMDRGSSVGLPNDPTEPLRLAVYSPGDRYLADGYATQVLAEKSLVKLSPLRGHLEKDGMVYSAEITSAPVAPLAVFAEGGAQRLYHMLHPKKSTLEASERRSGIHGVELVDTEAGTNYKLAWDGEEFVLSRNNPPARFFGHTRRYTVRVLEAAARYERLLSLENRYTSLSEDLVDLVLRVHPDTPLEYGSERGEVAIELAKSADGPAEWDEAPYVIEATNTDPNRTFHVALSYFSERLGIESLHNGPLPPGETIQVDQDVFALPDGAREEEVNYLLFVSTDEIPSVALIEQDDVPERPPQVLKGRGSASRPKLQSDWFTKRIRVRLIGRET